jgi:hypothetical protein
LGRGRLVGSKGKLLSKNVSWNQGLGSLRF